MAVSIDDTSAKRKRDESHSTTQLTRHAVHPGLSDKRSVRRRRILNDCFSIDQYVDVVGVIIAGVDESGHIELINRKGCEILGLQEEQILGRSWFINFTPADYRDDLKRIFSRISVDADGEFDRYEFPVLCADGTCRMIQWNSIVVRRDSEGRFKGAIATGVDVTERKSAEQSLIESEERFRLITELTSDYAYSLRVEEDGRLVGEWFSDAFLQMIGVDADLRGTEVEWTRLTHPDDVLIGVRRLDRLLSGHPDVSEFRILDKDRNVLWIRDSARPIFDETGERIVRLIGAAKDITEHKRAEEELTRSKRLFEKIFSSQRDAIFILDNSSVPKIVDMNRAGERIFGLPRDQFIGMEVSSFHVSRKSMEEYAGKLFQAIEERGYFELSDFMMRRADGKIFPTEQSVVALEDDAGERIGWISVVRDVTERLQARKELKAANDRLDAERAALQEKNIVLKGVLSEIEEEKHRIKAQIRKNVEKVILPSLKRLGDKVTSDTRNYVDLLERDLMDIASPFLDDLESRLVNLSPRETEICNMVKRGCPTKEIAENFSVSVQTINKQRYRIRRKLGLNKADINLRTFLESIQ